jgi:ABC-2 type transport system permease protein
MNAALPSPLRLLIAANSRQAWRRLLSTGSQNRLLTAVIFMFVGGYFLLAFWLFYRGMRFVETFPGLGGLLVERLLYLLFAFLFMLLLFSNVVISYSNFFRNRESAFLIALPIPSSTIFRWKFIESALLASWAFVFLIAPLLAAYGLVHRQPWHFYIITSVLVVLFVVLPSVAGSWAAVILARYMDRKSFQITLIIVGILAIWIGSKWLHPEAVTDEMLETRVLAVLDRMLMKTRFTMFPALPSYWLSTGVLNWAERAFTSTIFFTLVLLSNALFFGFLAFTKLGEPFYAAASAVQSRGAIFGHWDWFRRLQRFRTGAVYRAGGLERVLRLFLPRIRSEYLALLVKDIRVFWRDTTQWGQTLVLFGLLAVYVINLRHFSQQLTNPFWVNLVSFLNLGACSLNLATLTTRFVYPQFSLEGKRVWIVGMAPLGLVRVVKTKFALTSFSSLTLTLGLIWLSCRMLKLPTDATLFFAVSITVMTFALNGLATGLGVLYPNFREENPSKIVSGFGGTFCLVLSFLYIVASVTLLAIGSPWAKEGTQPIPILLACWGAFAIISMLTGWLPLKVALRNAAQFEY